MTTLLDPLDRPQQLLVNVVWAQFVQARRFPVYRYVEYVMRGAGYNAEAVIRSFPTVGSHILPHGYGAVSCWENNISIPPGSPVRLTIAALHHLPHDDVARGVSGALLACMRVLTAKQEQIAQTPFEVTDITETLSRALQDVSVPTMYQSWAHVVAEREWPGIRYSSLPDGQDGVARPGYLTDADFRTTDDYLRAVAAALTPPQPPAVLHYWEPRALLRALSFLDVTHELVLGAPLVEQPPMDRSCLLALPAETEADFAAGVTVLAETLNRFKVPGKNPSSGHRRLPQHLSTRLPAIDRQAVQDAVDVLDQIRVLRNSTVHPKPSPDLLQAHERLGLAFPIADFTAAWDQIRAHAERAISRLQEAIHDART